MKLLTESLPEEDLLKLCELLAAAASVPFVQLLAMGKKKQAGKSAVTGVQIITSLKQATLPVNMLAFDSKRAFFQDILQTGETHVINDLHLRKDLDSLFLKEEDDHIRSIILQPLQLTLPAGLIVPDSDNETDPRRLDGNDLPALHIVDCPVLLSLTDTQPHEFTPSEIENVKTIAGILAQFICQWTNIQHEQQKLRKLRHDLRSPLTSMTMLPDLMKATAGADAELMSMCDQMMLAARKLDEILADSVEPIKVIKQSTTTK